uniref:MPN domain-containing protein n=1 Tax=Chromera velia CCMP2878 TaxID=1169474 RepID=A0A0G4IF72_9ALVE|mmetsp:Transcript_28315/g.55435  ORF Transcript_28315/g.55435 Transcript_28315/m.55435 type:complete len:378 (+) Transcript_28315:245-1378(+)|eukprot:Cvel_13963.t1-p1 / transcript=Cvel_13963.t1 / gene=Cvel_13963 / organism=Chromera_velia_CCMP2878 / gene_product=COP9 signalosome complex subunit 5a, putative / transcript_product=COP9 signalosome complex subunit 5a, putative / location=Cvel_scaffold975:41517-46846(+) / protein_length=377 / sequence_SO=supercontig / SO=protein_coding / is_pseudo=false
MTSGPSNAQKNFELQNKIKTIDDDLYKFDEEAQQKILQTKPWNTSHNYFKKVKVSAVALIKMVMHARSGGRLEVMGLMKGKVLGDAFIILDAFALPVEGTETRVNAGNQANEYMIQYNEYCDRVNKPENVVGWYHSHPGYGCWLSGIDVQTEMLYQQHQEPFVAIVIDPTRTCAAGKVEIGAFRTYPESYRHPEGEGGGGGFQHVPLNKIEDFGLHWKQYYQLPVECFKSSLDEKLLELLWNKYWIATLSASPLLSNSEYHSAMVQDLAAKLEQLERNAASARSKPLGYVPVASGSGGQGGSGGKKKDPESELTKISREALKCATEQIQGLASQSLKMAVFAQSFELRGGHSCAAASAGASASSSSRATGPAPMDTD